LGIENSGGNLAECGESSEARAKVETVFLVGVIPLPWLPITISSKVKGTSSLRSSWFFVKHFKKIYNDVINLVSADHFFSGSVDYLDALSAAKNVQ